MCLFFTLNSLQPRPAVIGVARVHQHPPQLHHPLRSSKNLRHQRLLVHRYGDDPVRPSQRSCLLGSLISHGKRWDFWRIQNMFADDQIKRWFPLSGLSSNILGNWRFSSSSLSLRLESFRLKPLLLIIRNFLHHRVHQAHALQWL